MATVALGLNIFVRLSSSSLYRALTQAAQALMANPLALLCNTHAALFGARIFLLNLVALCVVWCSQVLNSNLHVDKRLFINQGLMPTYSILVFVSLVANIPAAPQLPVKITRFRDVLKGVTFE
jgi:hypothetical protein